jgi:hypothetical protein
MLEAYSATVVPLELGTIFYQQKLEKVARGRQYAQKQALLDKAREQR